MAEDLIRFRQALHRRPEVSGAEVQTALMVCRELENLSPDALVTGLGGHGVAAVFNGADLGPTVMIRAELDGLPIRETSGVAHASQIDGRGHLCGHDGHMAIVLGVGQRLSVRRPRSGRVVLMFQPAEENGAGAAAVMADPAFSGLKPDWAFALHNMPGLPLREARISAGPANCASVGLRLRFTGRTAHAATPATGLSPLPAIMGLLPKLQDFAKDGPLGPEFRLITLTHLRMGEATFGIAPGEAEVFLTLRCLLDEKMQALKDQVVALAQSAADQNGLRLDLDWQDDFAACTNDASAVRRIEAALQTLGVPFDLAEPMRASEDFGRFGTGGTKSAMFLLGSGEGHPALHDPNYDFPDALIPVGVSVFSAVIQDVLG